MCGEGRTEIIPPLLSSSLPVHEKEAAVPEILPCSCFGFGLSTSISKYAFISNCIHGINTHVPYLIFISPGTVVVDSPDTILMISIRKTKLKTYEMIPKKPNKPDKWLDMNSVNTSIWSGHRQRS